MMYQGFASYIQLIFKSQKVFPSIEKGILLAILFLEGCAAFECWIDIEEGSNQFFTIVTSKTRRELVLIPRQDDVIAMVSFKSSLDIRSGNWTHEPRDILRIVTLCSRDYHGYNNVVDEDNHIYDDQGMILRATEKFDLDYIPNNTNLKKSGPPFNYHVFIQLKTPVLGSYPSSYRTPEYDLRARPEDLCISVEGLAGVFVNAESNRLRIPASTIKRAIEAFDATSGAAMDGQAH